MAEVAAVSASTVGLEKGAPVLEDLLTRALAFFVTTSLGLPVSNVQWHKGPPPSAVRHDNCGSQPVVHSTIR